MISLDFNQGVAQERFANTLGTQRANRSAASASVRADEWMAYAQRLERQLADANAALNQTKDLLTVRTLQNRIHREGLHAVQDELKRVRPDSKLGDKNAMQEACRGELDRQLAQQGLYVTRTGEEMQVHRG